MSHNIRSRYARKSIKGSIDADFDLVFNKTLSPKMAHWNGAQGQEKMAKLTQKHLYLWRSPQKSSNPKRKKFLFICNSRLAESVEGLNSSLAQSPGELKDCKALQDLWRTRDLKGQSHHSMSGLRRTFNKNRCPSQPFTQYSQRAFTPNITILQSTKVSTVNRICSLWARVTPAGPCLVEQQHLTGRMVGWQALPCPLWRPQPLPKAQVISKKWAGRPTVSPEVTSILNIGSDFRTCVFRHLRGSVIFFLFFVNFGDGNWWQADAGFVASCLSFWVNTLAQLALRRFTQWPWINLPTFKLRGGHFTTQLLPSSCCYFYPHLRLALSVASQGKRPGTNLTKWKTKFLDYRCWSARIRYKPGAFPWRTWSTFVRNSQEKGSRFAATG